jgi:hypothetical protein
MSDKKHELGWWFICPNCGGYFAFFPEGYKKDRQVISPKSVAHSKPDFLINVPNSVECALYEQAELLGFDYLFNGFKIHEKEVDPPESFSPMTN